jgi:YD repeat-containing protein
VSKTDARGVVTGMSYDELNRVTQKSYSDGTAAVSYTYDSQAGGSPIPAVNPVGRLTSVTTATGGVTVSHYYSYCTCSSVDREATVIADGVTKTYVTSYTYNLAGAIMSITYPNGKVVTYARDSQGRETRVSSTVGYQSVDFVQQATYGGPPGELTGIAYPFNNGWVEWKAGYNAATGRISSLQTLGLNYSYNYVVPGMPSTETGHIYDIGDVYSPGNSRHFDYDRWYRLAGFWISGGRGDPYSYKVTWSYDPYGNMNSATRFYGPPGDPYAYSTTYNYPVTRPPVGRSTRRTGSRRRRGSRTSTTATRGGCASWRTGGRPTTSTRSRGACWWRTTGRRARRGTRSISTGSCSRRWIRRTWRGSTFGIIWGRRGAW